MNGRARSSGCRLPPAIQPPPALRATACPSESHPVPANPASQKTSGESHFRLLGVRLRRRRCGAYHAGANHPMRTGKIMASVGKIVAALAVAAAVVGTAHGAGAEESGQVRLIRTYVQDYTTIDQPGGTVTGGTLEGAVTILESSGGPFVVGTHDRATCVVYIERSEAGFDLEVPCETTTLSGERWYTLSQRRAGDVETGGGGPGTMKILGGTGPYEGLSGSCTYDVAYLPDDWVVMIADCTWRR